MRARRLDWERTSAGSMSVPDGPYKSFSFSTRRLSPSQGLTTYRKMLERSIGAHDVDTEESLRFALMPLASPRPGSASRRLRRELYV